MCIWFLSMNDQHYIKKKNKWLPKIKAYTRVHIRICLYVYVCDHAKVHRYTYRRVSTHVADVYQHTWHI